MEKAGFTGTFIKSRSSSQKNSDMMSKAALAKAEPLRKKFDDAWRDKVKQFQVSLYSPETKGAWVLRFDDILADALELGPLTDKTVSFSDDEKARIESLLPDGLPYEVAETVIAYCIANKPEDSDYVILPVSNFDAYFGSTSFSHKWLNLFPDTLLERDKQSFGGCRVNGGAIVWHNNLSTCFLTRDKA